MKGSEKQVAWAQDIISKALEQLDMVLPAIKAKREEVIAKLAACEDEKSREYQTRHIARLDAMLKGADIFRATLTKAEDARMIINNRNFFGHIYAKDLSGSMVELEMIGKGKWYLR